MSSLHIETEELTTQCPVILLLLFAGIGINAKLTATPRNEATLVNSKIRLECGTENGSTPLRWKRSSEDKHISFRTYVKPELNDTFAIDNTTQGRYDLIVRPGLNDADSYRCEDCEDLETLFSAQLIVLASNPVCNYTVSNSKYVMDEHHLVLECSVSFRGSWVPIMEWRIGTSDHVITDGVDNHTVFNTSATYKLNVNVSQEMCGAIFTCTTKFVEHMRPPNTDATNAPSYNHTWMYSYSDPHCVSRSPYRAKIEGNQPWYIVIAVVCILCLSIFIVAATVRKRGCQNSLKVTNEPDLVQQNGSQSNGSTDGRMANDYIDLDEPMSTDDATSPSNSNQPMATEGVTSPSLGNLASRNSTHITIGEDGTEYIQISSSRRTRATMGRPTSQRARTTASNISDDYATIDHTTNPVQHLPRIAPRRK